MHRTNQGLSIRHALLVMASLLTLMVFLDASFSLAQESPASAGADVSAGAGEIIDAAEIQDVMNDQPEPVPPSVPDAPSGIDLLTLIARGGAFMIPIGLMSLMVVTLAVERLVSLRKSKVLPERLIEDLEDLVDPIERFSPTSAHQSCLEYPSPTGRVVISMLMRTGQPLAEVERAASETLEREADQQAAPIRWLTLAAAATPLMGLLGTVWGMIVAFHDSTSLSADQSRSEQLSEGIYTALVTTLAGLIVAIPAAVLALYLENRLARLFHQVEEFAFQIAPALGQFTGVQRMDNDGVLHSISRTQATTAADSPLPPPPPRPTKGKRGGAKAG